MARAPGTRIGPYRIVRHLRSGGMAEVYEAVHEHLDLSSALKLLSPTAEDDPQMVGRFLQEGRALAQVDHPGVVRVLDCKKLDGSPPYIAMEQLHGMSLRDYLRQRGRLPWEEAAELVRQVAEAMAAVHAQGIVHRDLKPENLFLVEPASPGGHRQVKVLDFGISKVPASQRVTVDTQVQTAAPALLGTPIYMAPEQCRNPTNATDRADVYALGIVMYELLTGSPPFVGEELLDVMTQHLLATPQSLRTHVPEVPTEIAVLVDAMLAKDPQHRPAMAEVAADLARGGTPRPRRSLRRVIQSLWRAGALIGLPAPSTSAKDRRGIADREPLANIASLERLALAWELAGRPSQEMPNGTLLADYAALASSYQTPTEPSTSKRAQQFMAAVQQARRIRRRTRSIIAGVTAACVLAAVASGMAARHEHRRSAQLCHSMLASAEQELSNDDWDLAQLPHSLPLRLNKLQMLEQQLRTSHDRCDAAEVRQTLINIHHRRGDLALRYGTPAEAAPFYAAARGELAHGAPEPTLEREWQQLLALSDSKEGKLALAQGLFPEAQKAIDSSVQRLERLWTQQPDDETQRSLATGYSEQAQIAQLEGEPSVAAALYAKQIALLNGLQHEEYNEALLVIALGSHAESAAEVGDEFSARRSLARGFGLGLRLVSSKPQDLLYRWGLARLYLVLTATESTAGRPGESEAALNRALSLGRALHEGDRSHRGYIRFMAQALLQAEQTSPSPQAAARWHEERCRLVEALAQRTPRDPETRRLLCP